MDKRLLRAEIAGRGGIDPGDQLLVVSGLFVWLSGRLPGTVSAYLAMTGEVDVEPLFERLPGWRWVLPRVEPDRTLTFRDRDVPREIHRWGMEQPTATGAMAPVRELDVILVPGIAFDTRGARLGRGGGYYDRLLAEKRADTQAVGVTVTDRLLDRVPVHDHDRRVDWLATEEGVIRCSPKS